MQTSPLVPSSVEVEARPKKRRAPKLRIAFAALALAMVSLGAVASPASADSWKQQGQPSTTCQYFSFGKMCTTKTTYKRQSDYCNRGVPVYGGWAAYVSWYSWCHSTKTTTTFN